MNKHGSHSRSLVERLLGKISPEPNSGCWLWTGGYSSAGYGMLHFPGRTNTAHRLMYEEMVGAIPSGLDLDHLCRVRCCVNPAHLEPVSRSENLNRGIGPQVSKERQRRKTQCPWGHPYDEANTRTYRKANGREQRLCRTCQSEPRGRRAA